MRLIDTRHMGHERVIGCWEIDGVLIDPGPSTSIENVLDALGGEEPRALLLTHIHLDHAGATGTLVKRFPDLPVYVHERGAPHLVDPSKLLASAGQLYGDHMEELWGEVAPVPQQNITALAGGEEVLGFRVEYTPGHASHHVCYFHEDAGWAFVGDMAGVVVPPDPYTLAPTPPPDIDVEAWERSLDTIRAWEPTTLGLTHFGQVDDPAAQLDRVRESLHEQARLAGEHDLDGFVEAYSRHVHERAGTAADAILQAAPLDQLYQGLDRWRSKQGQVS
jgi:glyoxylase-like metal-dependent hydrolase (beta-lactamase superfamily II)